MTFIIRTRLARRTAEVNAGPASQAPLRHGDAVAARCSYLCGDQPGWTTTNDHEIIVATADFASSAGGPGQLCIR